MDKLIYLIGRIIAFPLLTLLKYEGRYRVYRYRKNERDVTPETEI